MLRHLHGHNLMYLVSNLLQISQVFIKLCIVGCLEERDVLLEVKVLPFEVVVNVWSCYKYMPL
jgi:hypothetical protein